MKCIYNILVISMICLLSNTTYAQFVPYNNDGTESCIDCEEKGAGTERSCLCIAPFQLGIFNTEILNLGGSLREEWLYEQELLLATTITGLNYFSMYHGPFGVPSDYNFSVIQENYFKTKETNKLANEYYPKVDAYFQELRNYNRITLRNATYNHKVLDIRKKEGVINPKYGVLKYKGEYLSHYPDSEINNLLNEELSIRDSQRSNFRRYDESRSRLERYYNEGWMSRDLARRYIRHYNGLGYEDAIRFMTRYMVWINEQDSSILYRPFGNPHNIFVLEDQDYTETIAINADLGPTMEGWTPREFGELNENNALFDLALKNLNAGDSPIGNFLSDPKTKKVEDATKKYMEHHRYGGLAWSAYRHLMRSFVSGYQLGLGFGADGPGQRFLTEQYDTEPNLLFRSVGKKNDGLNNRFWGFGNLLHSLETSEIDRPQLEGEVTRRFLVDNERTDLSLYFTTEEIARLFNYATDDYNPVGDNFFIEAYFVNNIGEILYNNGVHFLSMLDRPYVIEGVRALQNNQPFDFAFRGMVHNLVQDLSLDGNQENWLIVNPNEATNLDEYFRNTNNSDFTREALEALRNGGEVDFFDEVILDSSFLETNAYCVYSELKSRNGNLFRTTIGSFIDDPKYNLYFRVGDCDDPADMCTDDSELVDFNILTIKVDNLNLPSLENAANLLHEGVHAELFRFVNEANQGNVNPNERKRLFDLYRNFKGLSSMSSRAQHVYMVENYVTPIAKAIRELDNNKYPLNHYMGFGWDGLRNYDYQGTLTPEESTELYNLQAIVNQNTEFNPINCN